MPTDNISLEKLYFKPNKNAEYKELGSIKKLKYDEDAVDALAYYTEAYKVKENYDFSGEITITKESSRRLQKMLNVERITRKRFIKLLMGKGMQRNDAQTLAKIVHNSNWKYTHDLVNRFTVGCKIILKKTRI